MTLQMNKSVEDFIHEDLYTISKLEPVAEVAHHVPLIQKAQDDLMPTLAARNAQHNVVMKADARLDTAREGMMDTLEPVSLSVAAFFGSKSHPGYLRIFPKTVAQLGATPKKDQPLVFGGIHMVLMDEETPKAVRKLAEPYLLAYGGFHTAQADLGRARALLGKCVDKVEAAKEAVIIAHAKLRARLSDQYPRKPKIVARYFVRNAPAAGKGKGRKKAAVVEPVVLVPVAAVGEEEDLKAA